jgi:hypothetical protein
MRVPTIDGDIDVGNCFPLLIDVGGLGPRSLVDYTANRNDWNRADVVVVADVTIIYTCYCSRMQWVQTNQPIVMTGCTGCKGIILLCAIAGYMECKWIGFWLKQSRIALGANGSALVDRYWLYCIDCDLCNWVLSIDLMLTVFAVGADDRSCWLSPTAVCVVIVTLLGVAIT